MRKFNFKLQFIVLPKLILSKRNLKVLKANGEKTEGKPSGNKKEDSSHYYNKVLTELHMQNQWQSYGKCYNNKNDMNKEKLQRLEIFLLATYRSSVVM